MPGGPRLGPRGGLYSDIGPGPGGGVKWPRAGGGRPAEELGPAGCDLPVICSEFQPKNATFGCVIMRIIETIIAIIVP